MSNDKFDLENIYVADFETTTSKNFDNFSKVYLAGFQQLTKFDDKIDLFYSIGDFLRGLTKLKKNCVVVYFHNGSQFDIQFILNYVIKTLGYSNALTRKLKNKQFYVFEDEKRIYELIFSLNGTLLTFRDSILLIGSSIKKWGEIYGYEKLKIDYDNSYRPNHDYSPQVLEYFKRDITILNKALSGFADIYKNMKPISIAGQMFKKFDWILKDWKLRLSIKDYYEYQKYYYGGLVTYKTQLQNQWVNGHIYVYDINSSYPSVQKDDVPYSQPLSSPPVDRKYCTFYEIWIETADIKDDNWAPILRKPILGEKDNPTDYVKHQKCFTIYVVDCEWEWIKRFYNLDYEIVKKTYFVIGPIFRSFMTKMYQQRLELKKQKNKPAEMYVKTGLNSCYGRFAMRPDLKKTIYLDKNEQDKLLNKLSNDYIITKRNENSKIGKKDCFLLKPKYELIEKNFCSYIPLACYITAKARCKLLEAIWYNKDRFLYCDTDSIFTIGQANGILLHPTELGCWKNEAIGDSICYLQAKNYRILKEGKIIKQAHAGVREDAIMTVPNDQYKIPLKIEKGKLMKCKVSGGILLLEIPVEIGFNNYLFLKDTKVVDNNVVSGNSNEVAEVTQLMGTKDE